MKAPLFIVGCGRSGTTLFRLMLDSHPELAIPGESHFIPPLWRNRHRYLSRGRLDAHKLTGDITRTPHFRLWGIPAADAFENVERVAPSTFAAVVDAVFGAYAHHHDKSRWGDKTPIYVLSMPLLSQLFPQSRFVHLIRDGRDVASSYMSLPWGPATVWAAARKWRRDVTAGRDAGTTLGAARYMELRYEDLVADPKRALKTVCGFADLDWHEAMLDHAHDGGARLHAPPGGRRYHSSSTRAATPGLRDWRGQMPRREVEIFEAIAGPLLTELGYDRSHSRVRVSTRVQGQAVVAALGVKSEASRAKKVLLHRVVGVAPAGIDRDVS